MVRSFPILSLALLVVLAGCLGGLGLGDNGQTTTTTTTETATPDPPATTTTTNRTTTTAITTTTTSTSTTTTPATSTTLTSVARNTSAHIDAPADGERFKARVVEVFGPATIKVERESGETVVVDLLGVQTPRTAENANPAAFEGVPSSQQDRQKLGNAHERALQYTKSQFQKQVVTIATDPTVSKADNGHLRAYVYIGDFMYNTQLLRTGYARVTDTEFSKRLAFVQKMKTAQQNGYGLWSANQTA